MPFALAHRTSVSPTITRRDAIKVAIAAPFAVKPASASLVDERQAQRCFERISDSLVSLSFNDDALVKRSGFVWYVDANDCWIATSSSGASKGTLKALSTIAFANGGSAVMDSTCEYVSDANAGVAFVRVPIGLLKMRDAGKPRAAAIGTSGDAVVGRACFACACGPDGEPSLASGIVSGLNRKIPVVGGLMMKGLIQTDATVSESSSGGALCDGEGRVIGLCVVPGSQGREPNGVNFAVPIDTVRFVAERL